MTAGPITDRIVARRERLHVSLGAECNNNCLFCVEDNRKGRRLSNAAMTPARVRRILESHRGAEEVCFTSGEPTTRADLPLLVRWARQLGYPTVSLMTNGRRLAYEAYAQRLVDAGLTRVTISIHGHTARLHDGHTRTPGSFEQTAAGLDHAARLRSGGLELHTSTVVTIRNLPHLGAIFGWLRSRGVEQVVFNVMQATGRAREHFDRIFPTYSSIVAAFRELVDRTDEARPPVFLVDVPLCVSESCPDFNRGFVERRCHYEAIVGPGRGRTGNGPPAAATPEGPLLVKVTREDLDRAGRHKRPECAACRYDSVCEGVWRTYTDARGWDEFVPVTDEGTDDE